MEEKCVYNIAEFCRVHQMSVRTYYNLRDVGKAPVEMKVGTRRYISLESAANWRRERERDTAPRMMRDPVRRATL